MVSADGNVVIVASDHPAARRAMTMKTYFALAHVLVSPEGERHGLVDRALAQQGKRRVLALTLPQMFAAPAVVARTNMTATVMKRVALGSSAGSTLALFPPPMTLPDVTFDLIWHRRSDASPAQRWFRSIVESTAANL